MKKLLFFGLATLLFTGCQQPSQFVLDGTIEGADSGIVYLSNQFIKDSAIIKDGKFQFTDTLGAPTKVTLTFEKMRVPLFIEPTKMTLSLKKDDFVLTGSKTQDENDQLNAQLKPIYDSLRAQKAPEQRDSIRALFQIVQKEFIKANPGSAVTADLISNLMRGGSIVPDSAQTLYNGLTEILKSTQDGKNLEKSIAAYAAVQIGKMAPDFTLPDTTGTLIALSSLKGKYVLVDFWASWCGPCRYENPTVVEAFNTYKDKNFTVLGVSLDSNKEKWTEAILQDSLTWSQVSDLKRWDNAAARLYCINGIPSNVLLDPDGKIIDKNLRGEDLLNKLKEILK